VRSTLGTEESFPTGSGMTSPSLRCETELGGAANSLRLSGAPNLLGVR
jgi:hypothetical protein